MKNKMISTAVMFVFLISTAFCQYQISSSIIGSGGAATSNSNYGFNSTIGESFIGKFVSAANQQQVGFWYVYQQITITGVDDEEMLPTVFKLEQNYPNPFNPSTVITYSIPNESSVSLKIYNMIGQEVKTLVEENKAPGTYNVNFNASNLSSGVYFYSLRAGNYYQVKKMMLLK